MLLSLAANAFIDFIYSVAYFQLAQFRLLRILQDDRPLGLRIKLKRFQWYLELFFFLIGRLLPSYDRFFDFFGQGMWREIGLLFSSVEIAELLSPHASKRHSRCHQVALAMRLDLRLAYFVLAGAPLIYGLAWLPLELLLIAGLFLGIKDLLKVGVACHHTRLFSLLIRDLQRLERQRAHST